MFYIDGMIDANYLGFEYSASEGCWNPRVTHESKSLPGILKTVVSGEMWNTLSRRGGWWAADRECADQQRKPNDRMLLEEKEEFEKKLRIEEMRTCFHDEIFSEMSAESPSLYDLKEKERMKRDKRRRRNQAEKRNGRE